MKTTNVIISFDSEKLAALRQYSAKRTVSIETELQDALERLYEPNVPAAVREYLSERVPPPPSRPRPPRQER